MADEERARGRPRVWSDTRSRQRAHQQRQREKLRLVDDLLHAVRNAQWDEPAVHHEIQEGDDAAVLRVLIQYYRDRYWGWVQARRSATRRGGCEEM